MPIDYQSYLLSSSPPGFELGLFSSDHFQRQNGFNVIQPLQSNCKPKNTPWLEEQPCCIALTEESSTPISNAQNAERIQSWQNSYDGCTTNPSSIPTYSSEAKMGKKKVSFADDIGLALEEVRLMTESSDVPPTLRPEILARLNLSSSSFTVEPLSLILNFSQPSSDYLCLRNKVEKKNVSLESSSVNGCRVMGKIRVKNIAFEKRVFVRYTENNWESFNDIMATYTPAVGSPGNDTFAFEMSFPSLKCENNKKILFAICFETCDQQFWDNNDGDNYEVMSVDQDVGYCTGVADKVVFSLNNEDSFTNFSGWNGIDSNDPYW